MSEELPDEGSSIVQTEQEDASDRPSLDTEDIAFKYQESLEMHPTEETTKRMEDGQLKRDSKVLKRVSIKVKNY